MSVKNIKQPIIQGKRFPKGTSCLFFVQKAYKKAVNSLAKLLGFFLSPFSVLFKDCVHIDLRLVVMETNILWLDLIGIAPINT